MIYLDHAATSSPKPPEVVAAVTRALTTAGNPARGAHGAAREASRVVDEARLALARLLGVAVPWRVIFTLNGTDALDLAIRGTLASLPDRRGVPHVVTSDLEHNSISRPLEALRREERIELTVVGGDRAGMVDPERVGDALRPETALVALTMASNALGTLQPAEAFVAAVRDRSDAMLLLDAAQVFGAMPIDVTALGADLIAAPGHKALLGPTGTGILLLGERVAPSEDGRGARIAAVRSGGTGGDSSAPVMPSEFPWRLEAGTPNVAGLAGLGAGARWVLDRGVDSIRRHEVALIGRLIGRLGSAPASPIRVIGTTDPKRRAGAVSMTVDGVDPHEVSAFLDSAFDIAVRPGLHCAPGAHRAVGTFPAGTVRASVGPETTEAEIDALVGALEELVAG